MNQIRRFGDGRMRPRGSVLRFVPPVPLRLAFLLLALLAAGAAHAQTATLTQSFYFGSTGIPIPVTLETRDQGGSLAGGGTLNWDVSSCTTGPVFQPSPPPVAADVSGSSTANLLFSAPETCSISVTWDPDGPGTQPALAPAVALIDAVNPPLNAAPLTPLNVTTTSFGAPVFQIQVTDGGIPAPGMFVEWVVSAPDESFTFYGDACTPSSFTTDANGISTLDLSSLTPPVALNQLGTWFVEAYAERPGEGSCGNASKSRRAKGIPPNLVPFGMTVEDVTLSFQNPPTQIFSGTTGNPFTVLVSGATSGNPVSGASVNFSASPTGTVGPPSDVQTTDGSGLATFLVDAGSPDLMGGTITAQVTVPLTTPAVRSANTIVAVVDLDVIISTPAPTTPTFTDEQAAGFAVQTRADSGNGFDPAGNVPVTFSILSGTATFFGGATSVVVNSDVTTGIATSPSLQIGRGAGPVVVEADAGPHGTLTQNYAVQASTYSLSPSSTPGSQDIDISEVANLAVLLERSGSSTPVPLPAEAISWQIAPSNGSSITPPNPTTDTSGISTVSFVPAATGTYTVTATFNTGFTTNPTQSFTVNVSAPVLTLDAVSGDGQTGEPGATLPDPLVVQALDDGLPPASATIEWSATGGVQLFSSSNPTPTGLLTEPADASGLSGVQVILPAQPGSFVVTATRLIPPLAKGGAKGATTPGPSVSFTVSSGAPARVTIEAVEGNGQTGLVGSEGTPLGARVLIDGRPAVDRGVSWRIQSGDAQVSPSVSFTDEQGIARTALRFGPNAGPSTIIASNAEAGEAVFSVEATASPPQIELISGDNQTGVTGAVLGEDFVVRVFSQDGSPLANVDVGWSIVEGGGSLDADVSSTNAQGLAGNRLTLGNQTGRTRVRAALGADRFVDFIATATTPGGTVVRLVRVSGDGQRGLVGTRIDEPLTVQLLEAGVAVPNPRVFWEVLEGNATLDGAESIGNEQGFATMSLVFGAGADAVRIRARASAAADPVIFNLRGANPVLSGVEGNGQSGPPGETLEESLAVNVTQGMEKRLDGVPVQWRVLTGGGSFASAQTLSDTNGRASNQWTLGPAIGEQTAVAILPGGQQVPFTATAVAPQLTGTLSVVSGTPQNLAPGTPSAPLVVELRDGNGQPISGALIEWSGDAQRVSLRDASLRTGNDGRASNIATVLIPGAVSVSARVANSEIPAVTFQLTGGIAQIPGLNPQQRDVGTAIDNACPALAAIANRTPEQEDLFQRCSELVGNAADNPGEVRNALDELPADIGPSLAGQGLGSVDVQFDNLDTRLFMIRGEKTGAQRNQFNIGLWTPDGTLPLSFLPSALMSAGAADEEEAGLDFDRWGFFATGQIGRGEVRAGQRTPEFDYDIAGLTFGVDYRFTDRLVGGVALGYSDNDAELSDGGGDVATKGWNLSAYATWYSDRAWYVDGTVMLGRLDYDLQRRVRYIITALDGGRTVVDQVGTSKTDGDAFGTSISVGRDWQKGPWSLNGYLRGQYSRVKTDSFVETMRAGQPGAGLALAIDGRTTESMTSVVGGRATYILSRDWGILMPNFSVEWEHEFEDDPSRLTARLAFDPTGSVIERFGDPVDTDYFNVGVGVSALFPGGRSAYLYYEELLGASRQSQGLLSLGVRFEF
ncbi:autotransporter domain-containing protein [Pseudomarimonas salicorniae]|uniref:Autotransporter domain-containing protein n=1 Tax=Pseudomarimonas salicorniae TaxID=2933270 RepID=A0ABT0GFY6_9GAMM|nr:autotransporter domain-containing protein [Lysobacter sp. CAU 1642]MCK7593267.1 autotransporter domain-containing protein [Lysobacter sp. CAU 1642]